MRAGHRVPGPFWLGALLALNVLVLGMSTPPGPTTAPRRHVVEIRGMAYHPAVLDVSPGDTVAWINRDLVPHTATAADKPGWSTGNLAQEQSGVYVPRQRGTSSYFCELHPVMEGKLVVR
jgi:plastocyanin